MRYERQNFGKLPRRLDVTLRWRMLVRCCDVAAFQIAELVEYSRRWCRDALPSWKAAQAEDWLERWAMNLMLINVSTRRFGRAVRLPEEDIPATPGAGLSKSAVSRQFVALSAERMREWMAVDLSQLDLLAIPDRRHARHRRANPARRDRQ